MEALFNAKLAEVEAELSAKQKALGRKLTEDETNEICRSDYRVQLSDAPEDDELARALAMSAEQTASSPHDEPDDDDGEARYGAAVGELVSWGFERARVLEALEASGGDQQVAANILLG